MWGDRKELELRERLRYDPQFAAMFNMVYSTIANGDAALQDWRDAVSLAYTEWHARNVGPIAWVNPDAAAMREP